MTQYKFDDYSKITIKLFVESSFTIYFCKIFYGQQKIFYKFDNVLLAKNKKIKMGKHFTWYFTSKQMECKNNFQNYIPNNFFFSIKLNSIYTRTC